MAKQDEYVRYTVRIPPAVYDRIKEHAEEDGRSLNAEIVARLEQSFLWPVLTPGMRTAIEDHADLNGQSFNEEVWARLNFTLDYDREYFDPKTEWISPTGTLDDRISVLENQLRAVLEILHKMSGTTPQIDLPMTDDDGKPF